MASYFLDTSALAKRYFDEPGSARIASILSSSALMFVSHLTLAEMSSAISRRTQGKDQQTLLDRLDSDFFDLFNIAPLTDALVDSAVTLVRSHRIRGCDALQLATALTVATEIDDLIFTCADDDLNAAAKANGLLIDNPNRDS
jgi:uncharacterized protein